MKILKYIAFYLPQFHQVIENDNWWGEGFTEWVNVQKAQKLSIDHYQPREPLNDNYYNLLETSTLSWQADLAKEYNIFGFCFYHYWFEGGKKLLEKPAELLLKNVQIRMNFCFSWANEPWTRSWDGKNGEIIMNQDYGEQTEWKQHFDYVLPFFLDERYIKIDHKPVFVIYKPDSFDKIEEMISYWNELAISNGFEGIYFVRTLRSRDFNGNDTVYSAAVEFEPAYTNYNLKFSERLKRKAFSSLPRLVKSNRFVNLPYDYKKVVQNSLEKKPLRNLKTIPGIFVNWDNTPRKNENGIYFSNFSLNTFSDYVYQKSLIAQQDYHSEYLFINAWNEWAEGTYLEPDKKYGYGYLEAVRNAYQLLQEKK